MQQEIYENGLKKVLCQKRSDLQLTSWFLYQEIKMKVREELRAKGTDPDSPSAAGEILCRCVERMNLSIPKGSAFAGSQDDAFSPSYALINPSFKVESFAGYCDPVAIYDDMPVTKEFPKKRTEKVREYYRATSYVKRLFSVYSEYKTLTSEVAFFMEPVTGHMIPDMQMILSNGMDALLRKSNTPETPFVPVMRRAAQAVTILASRYADLAEKLKKERSADSKECERLDAIAAACRKVPALQADTLFEAIQSYLLLWETMCLEQAPNPYAFSAGNLDRVFQAYLKDTPFEEAVVLFRHLLAFFMVGRRGWAISQNFLLGGRDETGNDLSNAMTDVILEAFYRSNQPQPALSVKIHHATSDSLYRNMGRFFFTAGHSTPSLFNDDMVRKLLKCKGISEYDITSWAVAGCQEPLIMGLENGNTTNTWLNLAKILEITLNNGKSLLTDKKMALSYSELGYDSAEVLFADAENAFLRQLDYLLPFMEKAGNSCTEMIGTQVTPFGSLLFGGLESGRDMRDPLHPGVRYSGSGCLIHGIAVVTDSLHAIRRHLAEGGTANELLLALRDNFASSPRLRERLLSYPKYGSDNPECDSYAGRLAGIVADKVHALRNPSGAPYMPDYSTPSTHLLYGYWTGATPDGRKAREMLNYGIDPRPETAPAELTDQLISERAMPFGKMEGGYASHIGLRPSAFIQAESAGDKGLLMKKKIIEPLFSEKNGEAPFYVYFNIDDVAHLRKILADPEKYAPSGIYVMRIHGTFVNFLDLAPAIQNDIIERLERNENV